MEVDRAFDRFLLEIDKIWPEHARRLNASHENLSEDGRATAENNAALVCEVHSNRLDDIARNYKETCEVILEEELFFRRHGHYRAANVEEAEDVVAAYPGFWPRYLDGLLATQILWTNHVESCAYLKAMIIKQNPKCLLEIGPGHGLIISSLAKALPQATCKAWDINESAINATKAFAMASGVSDSVDVQLQDIYAPTPEPEMAFESIVLFEVLEHVDNPAEMLLHVKKRLAENGKIFVSIPINSPAPDHVGLYRNPEEIEAMAKKAGLETIEHALFPQTGYTLEKAIKKDATISYVAAWQ